MWAVFSLWSPCPANLVSGEWQGQDNDADRACMSEPIARHGHPGVLFTVLLPHLIGYTSSASIPQHRRHLEIVSPRVTILMPSHTTTRRLDTLSDWRQEQWAKSGTLMTISEYRRVHDQTTRSNGRTQQCDVFQARM